MPVDAQLTPADQIAHKKKVQSFWKMQFSGVYSDNFSFAFAEVYAENDCAKSSQ